MTTDRRREPVREVQLEGPGLVVVGALVVGALLAAFFAGRWYERRQHPSIGTGPGSGNPLANVELHEGVVDVAEGASFFDTVEGGEKEAEPARERAPDLKPGTPQPPGQGQAPVDRANPVADGPFYVQVFAGRDQRAAAELLKRLENAGQPARLRTDRQGTSTLYKVQVGGFATQEAARATADRLQASGYPGAWVTRVD